MVEKSYLVQKFARLKFGQTSILGYSVAGEESVVQVPELNVCFDIGRAPFFALTSDIVCITHAHMDHLAGLAYYLSQRSFQGMKPGTVLLPKEIEPAVDRLLKTWRDVERQANAYTLVPMSPGQDYEVRRDFAIRAVAAHHGGPALGYVLLSVREKLRPEFTAFSGPELAKMKQEGTEIQYKLEVPLVAYLGDTSFGPIFDHPDVQAAQVLLTECTFFEPDHKGKAKAGRHLHVDQLVEALAKCNSEHVVITHVSRRTGVRRSRSILRRLLGPEKMARIHFLMDFEGAREAGDVDDAGPVISGGE